LKRLGSLLVVLLWLAIAGLFITLPWRSRIVFNDPQINLLLSLAFRFGMSIVVAYIAARSYLLSGSLNVLFLGTGVLAFGLTGVAGSATAVFGGTSETSIAMNNIGALLASFLHFTGSTLTIKGKGPLQLKASLAKGTMLSGYLGILGFTALLTSLSLQGALPPFLTKQGSRTPLNLTVLVLTVALFALSSLVFMKFYSKSRSDIIYWYSLALALLATSSASFFLSSVPGDLISWLGRSATWLGSIYLLVAVLTAMMGKGKAR